MDKETEDPNGNWPKSSKIGQCRDLTYKPAFLWPMGTSACSQATGVGLDELTP